MPAHSFPVMPNGLNLLDLQYTGSGRAPNLTPVPMLGLCSMSCFAYRLIHSEAIDIYSEANDIHIASQYFVFSMK